MDIVVSICERHYRKLLIGILAPLQQQPKKVLHLTANPLRGLSAAELGRFEYLAIIDHRVVVLTTRSVR